MTSLSPSLRALAILIATSGVADACSGTPGKPFRELLADSSSIAIVRVEAEQLSTPKDPLFDGVTARVRVVEAIKGAPSSFNTIEFSPNWCGGHRLEVGAYYVVLLPSGSNKLVLGYEDQSILGLGIEYNEQDRLAASSSLLLLHFRNFARLGTFPEAFSVQPYLALARMPVQLPSASR
jgi:hypothetical protein